MKERKKIVFVATAITAPYVIKKVKAFKKAGFDTILYAYNRGSSFERDDNQELGVVVDLGFFESGGGYIKKLCRNIGSLRRVFKENPSKESIYILFSFDLALINLLFFKKEFVYHISDLTYTKVSSKLIVTILRLVDCTIVKKSKLTVVTSMGFQKYLFPNGEHHDKFLEIPNLLQEDNPYIRKPIRLLNSVDNLTFAFVGLNRYYSPLKIAEVIGCKFPQHNFVFYGNGQDNIMEKIHMLEKTYKNIRSFGRFNSTTDLEKIYEGIDILICCYDIVNANVKVAEPNKLYEAIFFNKPIVVSANTYLEEKVKKLNVGYGLNSESCEEIENFIKGLTIENYNQKLRSIKNVKTNMLIDNGEYVVKSILGAI